MADQNKDDGTSTPPALAENLRGLEKRFDDIKWYFTGASAVLVLVAGWNLSNERSALQQSVGQLRVAEKDLHAAFGTFKVELRAEIGKDAIPANLELIAPNGDQLEGHELPSMIENLPAGERKIGFRIFLRNVGSSSTGPIWIKFCSKNRFSPNWDDSVDEKEYKYENIIGPLQLDPNDLPGGFSSGYHMRLDLGEEVQPGKYPILAKVFYGKGKTLRTTFTLVLGAP